MKKLFPLLVCAALLATPSLSAQESKPAPAPGDIVAAAKAEEWEAITLTDLLVMELAPDANGKPRRVVIQLIPAPFSQGWVGNIRKLAAAKWWDGTSINRVQDNYVVQWGDATEKKALPKGLAAVAESDYTVRNPNVYTQVNSDGKTEVVATSYHGEDYSAVAIASSRSRHAPFGWMQTDAYASWVNFENGWPVANDANRDAELNRYWPVHCYAMVGVGRNLSPDTGTGAELYTVIGHAPRHLDRNIALVGRVIEGIEHLSSLRRGTGALGFYESAEERTPILSVRLGNETKDLPAFEYLSTDSLSFAAYADARANRRDPFFNVPAGGADICNIPVPVRRKKL